MRDYMLDPPEAPAFPCCPVCGSTLYEELYFDINNNVCGCSECISVKDAAEYWEEMHEAARQAHDDMLYDMWKDRQCGL